MSDKKGSADTTNPQSGDKETADVPLRYSRSHHGQPGRVFTRRAFCGTHLGQISDDLDDDGLVTIGSR